MIVDNGSTKVAMFDATLPDNILIASKDDELMLDELGSICDMIKVLEKNKERIQQHFKEKMGDNQEIYDQSGRVAATLTTIDGRETVNTSLLKTMFPDVAKACVYKSSPYKRFCLK